MISVWDSWGHKEVTEYMNMIKKKNTSLVNPAII